jgi:RNA ligase
LLRECRGIIFNYEGFLVSRPYHKFFNVNERLETLPENLDFSKPHVILEKLDGSFIRPLWHDYQIRWGTKAGLTDVAAQAEEFVKRTRGNFGYESLANECFKEDWTPVFEWCSRKQRIVVDYPEDRLILTACRHNRFGEYLPYHEMVELADQFMVPVVQTIYDSSVDDINAFVAKVREYKEGEGCVIRFVDGHMLKLKTDYYIAIHRAKDALSSERKIVGVIMEGGLDDLKAVLNEEDRAQIVEYEDAFLKVYDTQGYDFNVKAEIVKACIKTGAYTRKDFALEKSNNMKPLLKTMMFLALDGKDPKEIFLNMFKKNINNNKNFAILKDEFFPQLIYKAEQKDN